MRDRAESYALGLLDAREAHAFREHLAEGCSNCGRESRRAHKTVSSLSLSVPEAAPSARLRDRILDRVSPAFRPHLEGIHVVRAEQAGWQSAGLPGVSMKQLYSDPARDSVTIAGAPAAWSDISVTPSWRTRAVLRNRRRSDPGYCTERGRFHMRRSANRSPCQPNEEWMPVVDCCFDAR